MKDNTRISQYPLSFLNLILRDIVRMIEVHIFMYVHTIRLHIHVKYCH